MKFSTTTIARNEAKTLPRLVASLKGADEIVILDTGSTDGTPDVARALGAKVYEVGEQFMETPTRRDMETFANRYGFLPTFTEDMRLFNYAAARNHAMSLAENDWCFCPDADEEVVWDLGKVRALLPECDQVSYRFAFAHNPDGTPSLELTHCKFLDRTKGKWHKKIHEVVIGIPESRLRYCPDMYLHHWQQLSENRTNFLPKLEYAVLETEKDDRNTYYLAREYFYAGEHETAIKMFDHYLALGGWKPERSQALIFQGHCYKWSGRGDEAVACYHRAMQEDDTRREPFFALGQTYYEWARYRSAAIYLRAACEIPLQPNYYLNDMNLYTWQIWDLLSLVYDKLGERDKAAAAWLEAVKGAPNDQRILNNGKWFHRRAA